MRDGSKAIKPMIQQLYKIRAENFRDALRVRVFLPGWPLKGTTMPFRSSRTTCTGVCGGLS